MSRAFRALKITALPLLFAAVALGLATVHISAERKAARAKMHAAHPIAVQDANLPGGLAGLKLQSSRRPPKAATFRRSSKWPGAWLWARA
jgi:hypothetical protein